MASTWLLRAWCLRPVRRARGVWVARNACRWCEEGTLGGLVGATGRGQHRHVPWSGPQEQGQSGECSHWQGDFPIMAPSTRVLAELRNRVGEAMIVGVCSTRLMHVHTDGAESALLSGHTRGEASPVGFPLHFYSFPTLFLRFCSYLMRMMATSRDLRDDRPLLSQLLDDVSGAKAGVFL